MIKGINAFASFGLNSAIIEAKYMTLWDVPADLEVGVIPKKIYCNKLLVAPLTKVFKELILSGAVHELKTWDGCYNPRPIRGYELQFSNAIANNNFDQACRYASMHYWGLAVDVNAAWNRLGQKPTLSAGFVKCFTENGFDWGGEFKRLDGMHFQLAALT